jgi:uncharacterized protein
LTDVTPESTSGRPVPEPDERSAPYWAAAADHVLTVARCSRCLAFTVPPDEVCPNCLSTEPEFRFVPIDGRGTIRSWTVVRQAFLPGFEVPFVLVDVELAEAPDVRLIGGLTDGPDAQLRLGGEVEVVFDDLAPGTSVPAFRLARSIESAS